MNHRLEQAVARQNQGDLDEAARLYLQVLASEPGDFNALHLLGTVRSAQGRYREAADLIAGAIATAPTVPNAHYNLAVVYDAMGRPEEAMASYRRVLAIDPNHAEAHYNLANLQRALGDYAEAEAGYRRAVALRPGWGQPVTNLAGVLVAVRRFGEASALYRQALTLDPRDASLWRNLGTTLAEMDRNDDAIVCFRQGLALAPEDAETHCALGKALWQLNRCEAAIASFQRAQVLRPAFADAGWHEGVARLTLGDMAAGWLRHEWRLRVEEFKRPHDFPTPPWSGEPIAGRTILLHAEQGFGDTLQFVRYAPLVAARGARVVLEVQRPLSGLLSGFEGCASVIAYGDPVPDHDAHCPLPSLPLALGGEIPANIPYLAAPAERVDAWRSTLGASTEPGVGVVWAGSGRHTNDRNRSLALDRLRPVLATPGIRFFSLQKDLRDGDGHLPTEFPGVAELGSRLTDFTDTAAVVSLLDLVITVDTSVAHLAGALGRPTWVMIPFRPDWRWQLGRNDSPWYPSVRLFRQPRIGDWDAVVAEVRQALVSLVRTWRRPREGSA